MFLPERWAPSSGSLCRLAHGVDRDCSDRSDRKPQPLGGSKRCPEPQIALGLAKIRAFVCGGHQVMQRSLLSVGELCERGDRRNPQTSNASNIKILHF